VNDENPTQTAPEPAPEASAFAHVPNLLRTALEARGFRELTPVQTAALAAIEPPRDLQISSQTGSGKTVALGLAMAPGLLEESEEKPKGPRVLIIVPTRELAAQVKTELAWLFAGAPGVTLDCVTGGTNPGHERGRLQRKPRILVGTPGRLGDHLRSGALDLSGVTQLVLDEADQMLDMGFREELEAILVTLPAERRTHLVSATFPVGIQRLAASYQVDPLRVEGTPPGEAHEDIEHVAYLVNDDERYAALVNLLLITGGDRTLVFVNTRAETTLLAERLAEDGFAAMPLSGELQQSQRTRTLAAFKAGTASVLVATDVAARGLDVPDVATVIHGSPAMDAEVYTHRSGRTGRAGRKGRSLVLALVSRERRLRRLFNEARVEVEWKEVPNAAAVRKKLKKKARRQIHKALDGDQTPPQSELDYAQSLLEGRDAVHIIATLLQQTAAEGPTEPREVTAPVASPRLRKNDARKFEPRPAREFRGKPAGGARFAGGSGPRFTINWGFQGGASPQRLLAHICRRGGISGAQVGQIRVDARTASFDVDARVAADFEQRVRGRDARDPRLVIRRAGGRPARVFARS